MMVRKGFVDSGQNLFGNHLADFEGVISIDQDFWFDNWDKTVHLADWGISSQDICIFNDG